MEARGARSEKEVEVPGDHGHVNGYQALAPSHESQAIPLRNQNGELFSPRSPIKDDQHSKAEVLRSTINQLGGTELPAPRYEALSNVVHEADAQGSQVHETQGDFAHPSQLPSSRTEIATELPAEKPYH